MMIQVAVKGYDKNFSYFVVSGKRCLVVDPVDTIKLKKVMREHGLILEGILVTHSHFDHVEGLAALEEEYDVVVYGHHLIKDRVAGIRKFEAVNDGDTIIIGQTKVEVLYTPGHIDDAVCYLVDKKELVTGDTLFVEGCGRADFENSDVEDLWNSLKRIRALDEDIKVYPGHDYGSKPFSTIGYEKAHNRYLLCADFEEFKSLRLT